MTDSGPASELVHAARNPWWRAAALLGLVALALTAALGGLRKAPEKAMTRHTVGERADTGALFITPSRAWISQVKPGRTPDPASSERYLVLRAVIEDRTRGGGSAYAYLQSDLVRLLPTHAPIKAKSLQRADDHSAYLDFPPRLPVEVDLVWALEAGEPWPERADFGAYRRRFVEETYLTRESGWIQGDPGTRWSLAVEDRRTSGDPP